MKGTGASEYHRRTPETREDTVPWSPLPELLGGELGLDRRETG